MTKITIQNLTAEQQAYLRERAARNGRSVQAEAQEIFGEALKAEMPAPVHPDIIKYGFVGAFQRRFAKYGGVELNIPPREPMRDPPDFNEFDK